MRTSAVWRKGSRRRLQAFTDDGTEVFGTMLVGGNEHVLSHHAQSASDLEKLSRGGLVVFAPWTVKDREQDKAGEADHIKQNLQPRRHGNLPNTNQRAGDRLRSAKPSNSALVKLHGLVDRN
jgi:hypothetical protein